MAAAAPASLPPATTGRHEQCRCGKPVAPLLWLVEELAIYGARQCAAAKRVETTLPGGRFDEDALVLCYASLRGADFLRIARELSGKCFDCAEAGDLVATPHAEWRELDAALTLAFLHQPQHLARLHGCLARLLRCVQESPR